MTNSDVHGSPDGCKQANEISFTRLLQELPEELGQELSQDFASEQHGIVGNKPRPIFIELCCGSAGLTAACARLGFRAFGVDWKRNKSKKPPAMPSWLLTIFVFAIVGAILIIF